MNNIRRLRTARGLTQSELADMAGVDQATISKIERGNPTGLLETYVFVAEALNVSLSSLFAHAHSDAEADLLVAFRRMPPDRQQGWLDWVRAEADRSAANRI